ncbi:MAG: twin-arginine translocase TatA/TatE family subunit [Blastocatellia bacterium]
MNTFLYFIGGLGPTELIIILVILLVLFGGSRLPSLAKGLGESVRSFKKGIAEEENETKESKNSQGK